MAYVPVLFPMVRYDAVTGLPVTVTSAAALAALPATFAPVPVTPAAIQAFPPSLIAQAVKIPITVILPAPLPALIAVNTPTKSNGSNESGRH